MAIDLAEIAYDDGTTDYYQLPLALYAEPQDRLSHAFVGEWDDDDHGTLVYDALHDRESMALWLRRAAHGADPASTSDVRGDLTFHRLPGHDLDLEAHSTLFSGEQSNSSVAFGEDALMKVFRKVTPGVNPDIAIHQVLTEAGSTHVAALYGWLDLVDDDADGTDSTIQLAMLQQFLRTASDGWDLALASVRNLFAEADLHADEVGGDFAGEAARLGIALAEVHADLAAHFPVEQRDADARSTRSPRRWRAGSTPRSTSCPTWRRTPTGCARRSAGSATSTGSTSSRSTATCTSARPCAPSRAGRSSTSRASRPSRSPSACCPTRSGATWPG